MKQQNTKYHQADRYCVEVGKYPKITRESVQSKQNGKC